jgi:hypothetical protein
MRGVQEVHENKHNLKRCEAETQPSDLNSFTASVMTIGNKRYDMKLHLRQFL